MIGNWEVRHRIANDDRRVTRRFALRQILPFAMAFLTLLVSAIAADFLLHQIARPDVGRQLGWIGASVLLVSFLYSLRKRKLVPWGQPKRLLALHESLGWVGAVLLLVHGGVHFNAEIPWLAIAALLVVVVSGLTGKYLLARAREALRERESELKRQGIEATAIEREIMAQALLVRSMQNWRAIHLPLTMVFLGFALVHVVATFIMWRWF